jgi:hypothetical protein
LLGERPAPAVADAFDDVVEGFIELELAALDQDKPSRCAGEECKPGIDEGVHGARPASLRTAVSGNPARCQARPKIK